MACALAPSCLTTKPQDLSGRQFSSFKKTSIDKNKVSTDKDIFCCFCLLMFCVAGPSTCLEDSTERSESNPGRSLGIYKQVVCGCLEDSTKISVQSVQSVFEKKLSG